MPPTADAPPTAGAAAVSVCPESDARFLDSLGINTHIDQGYDAKSYIAPLRYLGIRAVRDGERHVDGEIAVAQATGARFVINAGGDLAGLIKSAEALAHAGALLALEGPNEPNNFPIIYNGQQGGGRGHSWYAVAAFQAALYSAVRSNPTLQNYPVFGPSETGAETDNVGLQYAQIPEGNRDTTLPPGTRFSDYVNIHNYVSKPGGGFGDNQAWNAASPTLNGGWDGLYGNSGVTWFRNFAGYAVKNLPAVPRVTTETGWDSIANPGGQAGQGDILTNAYLAQFKRGWRYTFIYELRDGEGSIGHQGLYDGDKPKIAALMIHNLTTILADAKGHAPRRCLRYAISPRPDTVHDLLLQKGDGELDLVIWDERAIGEDKVTVSFPGAARDVRLFDITSGPAPIGEIRRARQIELSLSNHAVILALPREP